MTGPTGEQGPKGDTGARGEAGSTGMRGPRGIDTLGSEPADVSGPLAMDFIRKLTLSVLGLLVIVVAFLIFYLVTYVQEQRLLSECYRQAFEETNRALVVTVAAAARDRGGLKTLLESLTDPERTGAQRSADLEKYLQLLADGEADRAATPVLPARTC
ncbi:collagen-like protein [Pseudonocardia sp. KRD-184]|uniref:Collagen-like protein n=1 Tax=Pseudonocardia oceani TaxID=2792013 RepID=A0ABS6UK00_9PSEU|nr:collagen-like protein [Pseudonocardia oceani]MBW0088216.1 collagen-like protein [Pseudonocardia oceani]MBW0100022.1 collagen-like protein [Pseudonocardia oceani]MBW0121149.1 collagen-like protein [Pseudonocardia oceani]MBW0131165.1 collagen-like protein [Pseudonocardia oceani]MBW0132573.1 collagen-like protein [Pseudonocardia oceani]